MKTLTVITPVVPTGSPRIKLFTESAKWHGLNVVEFGDNGIWSTVGSDTIHQYRLAGPLINTLNTDLVLFSDSFDAFFCAGAEEIISKYERMGAPVVYSAEQDLYPPRWAEEYATLFQDAPWMRSPWSRPNCGGWIGPKDLLIYMLDYLRENYLDIHEAQPRFIRAFMDGNLPMVQLDHHCRIFQTMSGSLGGYLDMGHNKRPFNITYGHEPCIIHFNGRTGQDGGMEKLYRSIYDA